MKVCYSYLTKENLFWEFGNCYIIDSEKYSKFYSIYLAFAGKLTDCISVIDNLLNKIKKIEENELKYYQTGTELFSIDIYKDRVEFEDYDEKFEKWSCTLEEYKRVLLGKKAFLMLPEEKESYLEIKINDIE